MHPGGGISGPALAGGMVYLGSRAGNLFRCVDAVANGDGTTTCVRRCLMDDRVYESVPNLYARKALFLCDDGWLYAFN